MSTESKLTQRTMNASAGSLHKEKVDLPVTSDKVRAAAKEDFERLSQSSFNKKKAQPRTLRPIEKKDPYAKPLVPG